MESLSLQRRAGFTFLEVMIVVMIIGILAAMAVPGLAGAADAAKEARIRSDLQTIGSAVELYHVQHGAYPDSLDVLAESGNGKEGYLKSVPESPDEKTSYTLNTSMTSKEILQLLNVLLIIKRTRRTEPVRHLLVRNVYNLAFQEAFYGR